MFSSSRDTAQRELNAGSCECSVLGVVFIIDVYAQQYFNLFRLFIFGQMINDVFNFLVGNACVLQRQNRIYKQIIGTSFILKQICKLVSAVMVAVLGNKETHTENTVFFVATIDVLL